MEFSSIPLYVLGSVNNASSRVPLRRFNSPVSFLSRMMPVLLSFERNIPFERSTAVMLTKESKLHWAKAPTVQRISARSFFMAVLEKWLNN